MPFSNYDNFVRSLEDREHFGQKLGLDRIRLLLEKFGNPHDCFPSVHIAGTNGKGSTAAMIASILKEAGFKVGLYTSPHLEDFCERIRVNETLISPDQVLRYERAIEEVSDPNDPPTFFELATAMAFLHFMEEKVDIAVIETGLGGRLDATNVITPLISVITSIGLDHTKHLGETIEEIAFEKAGIIKPGVPVMTGFLPPEAMEVIHEVASSRRTACRSIQKPVSPNLDLSLAGEHQRQNAMLAMMTVVGLETFGGFKTSEEAIIRGLTAMTWPGRLETISEKPWILLDGAHNPSAMSVIHEYLEQELGKRKLVVLFGVMADKDIEGMLRQIAPLASEMIFVRPNLRRAADPHEVEKIARAYCPQRSVIPDVGQAFQTLRERLSPEDVLLVTGSFFVAGEVRKVATFPAIVRS